MAFGHCAERTARVRVRLRRSFCVLYEVGPIRRREEEEEGERVEADDTIAAAEEEEDEAKEEEVEERDPPSRDGLRDDRSCG